MKVSVVILNWNGKSDTLACLQSLENLLYSTYNVVVVDNGSTDDSVCAIRSQFPEVQIIETGENLGYSGGNNVGISFALGDGADAILLLNNDTIVAPDFLNGYVEHLFKNPQAVLGGRVYRFDEPNRFDHLGGMWNQDTANFDLVGNGSIDDGESWEEPIAVDFVCGCSLFASSETFKKVGLLEEKFFLIWEESDWCERARTLGHPIFYCPKARLWHKVSASFTGGKPLIQYFWWRNRLLWISRNRPNQNKLVIVKEALHLLKLYLIKKPMLIFRTSNEKKNKVACYYAALRGITHHLIGRYGNPKNT